MLPPDFVSRREELAAEAKADGRVEDARLIHAAPPHPRGLGSEPAAAVATGGERVVPGAATLNVPTPAGLGYENADDGFRHPVLRLQERPASCALDHRVANGSCGRCHPLTLLT